MPNWNAAEITVDGVRVANVGLPDGRVWFQRLAPDTERFRQWCEALVHLAEHPDDPLAPARERVALIAAYDAGWNATDAAGRILPPPAVLDLAGWNCVPRAVIETILDHIDAQAEAGLRAAEAERKQRP